MRHVFSFRIPMKVLSCLALLALVMLLIPMLNAARFDVPALDDYSYGLPTHRVWTETGNILSVLNAAVRHVKSIYYGWQGTFSAIFLFTLNPMIFGEQYYQIGPWLILLSLFTGVFLFTFSVWGELFKAAKSECLLIAVVWAVLCTQFLPRASQGIYWFNGAVYYTFFFGLAAIACSMLVRFLLGKNSKIRLTVISILLFIISGGNLVTGLTTAVLLVSMEFFLLISKQEEWKPLLLPVCCYFAGFMINVIAPGNAVRQSYFAKPDIFRSVVVAFEQSAVFGKQWFSLPVISLIILLIPVFMRITRGCVWQFRMPWLVTLYSVCLTGVMFYPPIYAMTEHNLDHLGRIINVIYFGMLFLAIFNLFYWVGWLMRKGILPESLISAGSVGGFSVIYLLAVLLIFVFGMTQIKWFDTTSISAYRSYRSGQMGHYGYTYKQRLKILKDPEVNDAVLKRFPYRPYVLFYHELSEYPEENTPIAAWYGKNSVIAK